MVKFPFCGSKRQDESELSFQLEFRRQLTELSDAATKLRRVQEEHAELTQRVEAVRLQQEELREQAALDSEESAEREKISAKQKLHITAARDELQELESFAAKRELPPSLKHSFMSLEARTSKLEEQHDSLCESVLCRSEEITELREAGFERERRLETRNGQKLNRRRAAQSELNTHRAFVEAARRDSQQLRSDLEADLRRNDLLLSQVDSHKCAYAEHEVARERLLKELSAAREAATECPDDYWEQAPFLSVSETEVMRLRGLVEEREGKAAELQSELERKTERVAQIAEWRASKVQVRVPSPAPWTFPVVAEVSQENTPETPRPRRREPVSPTAPKSPASPVRVALSVLEEENVRLRDRISGMRGLLNRMTPGAERAAGDVNEKIYASFQGAVMGTGARVMDHMRQSLQDDVGFLRRLHASKQSVDEDFRQERRLRASLERRLKALEASRKTATTQKSGVR